ncbi:DNA-processing protein DprA [Thermolongibacillus altinsuensis]
MQSLWLALTFVKGLGVKRIKRIYHHFPKLTLSDWEDDEKVSQIIKIIKNKTIAESLSDYHLIKQYIKKAEESIAYHKQHDIEVVTIADLRYPKLLKKLDDAPIVLYCKGNLNLLDSHKNIAVVGTRNPTPTGRKMARRIAKIFSEKGYVIVSGLALGIDTEAHIGALEANGKTISVLAGGLDSVFPKENAELAAEIIKKDGLLISEQPMDTPMFRAAFVQRDRIQSGLSLAVCPVQTDIKGGTQHTIKFAKDQNRLLFCPIPIEEVPVTRGIFRLLEEGAVPLGNSDDIPLIENCISDKWRELFFSDCFEKGELTSQKSVQQLNLFN